MILSTASLGLAGVTGLALGSFAVTAGLRLSRGEDVLTGRSRCDACGRALGFVQTVPMVSYAAQRGVCASCGGRIDPTHLAGELAGAVVLATSLLAAGPLQAGLLAVLGLTLVVLATVDWKVRRLPDMLTLVAAAAAAGVSFLRSPAALVEGLVASAVVAGVLLAIRESGRRLRGDPGLGLGDVKLLAALALWMGAATPWLVALASALGLVTMALARPQDGRMAFGPAIAIAAWTIGVTREAGLWPTTM